MDKLQKIADQGAAGLLIDREIARFGPFMAALSPHSDCPWVNYAVPITAVSRDAAHRALSELEGHFRSKDRIPRFEFMHELVPELSSWLEQAGYSLQVRHVVMGVTPAEFHFQAPSGVDLVPLTGEGEDDCLQELNAVLGAAFGTPGPPLSPAELSQWSALIREGVRPTVVGYLGKTLAGGGCLTRTDAVAELAGVGTAEPCRRQGAALAVSSRLLADFFASGGDLAWLSTEYNSPAARVYARLGFQELGWRVNYMLSMSSG